ncbi:acetyl-CoA carboxylase carboxyltransferase subunit alpha [Roseburia sp. 1XD42-69]|uniref:acetyl-CoA carboxylase carboxyltransferase subunit alpha n=1 Tax=Roseburia sp. 1XD42-69 TaxID=2320088 RepID=UPI000EA15575|nr:acetyl-CoA carboxylase carboxyltransferase subunit alpha [Roseburia sp. 1XD42-69]RKJ63780.1 acetyl-CoA carboxylase carboxyltransferase subunit beta [Roseburia sp. 1XD42-69]
MAPLFKKKNATNTKGNETKSTEGKSDKDIMVCPACKKELVKSDVKENKYVCYACGNYFRVRTSNRIKMVADAKSFSPWFEELETKNPLDFPEYEEKLAATQEKTGLHEGVTIGAAKIYGEDAVVGVCDARFLMGSMGHVVGEKIASAVERATEENLPVILFCCSGGARMQEGIISLMQMAKTSAALKKHSDAGLLYIPVLTDPTTGGVTASFAMLGDIILAEPGALIGFAGPRVIEQTIGQKLPEGFQRAEFQLEHGFVDAIVERKDLKKTLYKILKLHRSQEGFANFTPATDFEYAPSELMKERSAKSRSLTAWEKVKAARKTDRPASVDYMDEIFNDFIEFHGDRYFRDDPAVVGGIAYLDGQPVTVIGVHKGKDMKDCMLHNYGMPSPEGYRKALRLMKQAEKFGRPIITFVNTSGAFCGMEAEEGGQGEAIARNLYEMSAVKVPILTLMIGEGGSGGALALAVGNEVWMMENATYSVLSPEGFASILWKDGKRAKEAAEVMKITAQDLLHLNVVEKVIPEYGGADDKALHDIAMFMKCNMREFLEKYKGKSGQEIAEERYQRFRSF